MKELVKELTKEPEMALVMVVQTALWMVRVTVLVKESGMVLVTVLVKE